LAGGLSVDLVYDPMIMAIKWSGYNLVGEHAHRNMFFAIVIVIVAAVLLPEQVIGGRLYDYMVALILIIAVIETTATPRTRLLGLIIGIPAIGARLVYAESVDSNVFGGGVLLLNAVFFVFLIWNLLRDLLKGDRSTSERVFGALMAYLCIGVVFALIYAHAFYRDPGCFRIPADLIPEGPYTEAMMMPVFTYFSFVTMTTLGYGDFVPLTEHTRSLAWIEAMIGQLYLAVMVGGLVGVAFAEATKQAPIASWGGKRNDTDDCSNDENA
jgi:hypothetical protein